MQTLRLGQGGYRSARVPRLSPVALSARPSRRCRSRGGGGTFRPSVSFGGNGNRVSNCNHSSSSMRYCHVNAHACVVRPTDRPLFLWGTGPPIIHQGVPVLRGDALPRHSHHEGRGPGNLGHQGSTGRVLHGQRYSGASVGAWVGLEGLSCRRKEGALCWVLLFLSDLRITPVLRLLLYWCGALFSVLARGTVSSPQSAAHAAQSLTEPLSTGGFKGLLALRQGLLHLVSATPCCPFWFTRLRVGLVLPAFVLLTHFVSAVRPSVRSLLCFTRSWGYSTRLAQGGHLALNISTLCKPAAFLC